ncbi:MAG: glutaminyl-peptide cyclotransferase [Actinomycetia bacterium]|nr:glutaminyl-peptide cyclotransferase [Actinomycetes bacterium]
MARLLAAPLLAGLILVACGSTDTASPAAPNITVLPSPTAPPLPTGSPTTSPPETSAPTTVPVGTAPRPAVHTVVASHPHDTDAFTQGLIFWADRFVESTGRRGDSDLRVVDPDSGYVAESRSLDSPDLDDLRDDFEIEDQFFGEGLARVDDRLIQLTWTSELALVWDLSTLELEEVFTYSGQGWGLCHDGSRVVMSDGSSVLTFRNPQTFDPIGTVEVTWAGTPIGSLNELECVDGRVWANIWKDNRIVIIDPATGAVTHVLSASDLVPPGLDGGSEVLNGIAHDPATGRIWVTGKNWPALYELSVELG